MDIAKIRKEYQLKALDEKNLKLNPLSMFSDWFEEACNAQIDEVNAMALATVDSSGFPSLRMVLLKGIDDRGFQFFTRYSSRKGHDIEQNPHAAAVFYWKELERQVTIEGAVEKLSKEASDQYFAERTRESQIAAWASEQGKPLTSRQELEERYQKYEQQFRGGQIPPLPNWGGYRIIPYRVEFWQGRPHRLHDRHHYLLVEGKWQTERLSP